MILIEKVLQVSQGNCGVLTANCKEVLWWPYWIFELANFFNYQGNLPVDR